MKKMTKKKAFSANAAAFIITLIILTINIFNVNCYIEQYEKNYHEKLLKDELAKEQNDGERLRIEYESRTNYKAIEEYVTKNFMMKKIDNYQIEYIVNDAENTSEVVKADDYDEGFFNRLSKAFSMIAEYFN
jgi:hypothetical protein